MINIYVGNLPYSVNSNELREAFESFGQVASAEVIFDRRTKRSRGYGFVEMNDEQDGRRAIEALNGSDFKGRELRVDESQARDKKPQRRSEGSGRSQSAPAPRPASEPAAPAAGGGLFGFVRKLFG
ncbi:MAG: RNA recognition motif domain-containing protein [Gammaproteobacteria bacterium]